MKIVFDAELNGLENPTKVWCIVCKEVGTGVHHIFRNLSDDEEQKNEFLAFSRLVDTWIGHNVLGYDLPHLQALLGLDWSVDKVTDTLVVSKLVDYSRSAHSIEQYGEEFGYPKIKFTDFSKYSEEMETYCVRDVDICHRIYSKYSRIINDLQWHRSLRMEHEFQVVTNDLHSNGFAFNHTKASKLLLKVKKELGEVDAEIAKAFPKKLKLVREVTPKATKHGTISLSSIPLKIRKEENQDLSAYSVGAPFSFCSWVDFNPSSHKQLIEVLNASGWKPTDKTQTHIDTERALARAKYAKNRDNAFDIATKQLHTNLDKLRKTGWKINENNLSTLPSSAPPSARALAKRILLESRRRTLTEWLALVQDDGRIHGKFYAIGAWTHRMAHQNPNTANIPTDAKLFGSEMRSLWQAPKNRLLVGVDAEGIQLRIFAHYVNDPELTESLVKGQKHDKTDPHSLNQRIIGDICKSRQHAKRFIYALFLGAGFGKLGEVLECPEKDAREAVDRILERYPGFKRLKESVLPRDGARGYFVGLDGRRVKIPGDTEGTRKHLAMSGYLQNGEAVVMKLACLKWANRLKDFNAKLVNFVHDEWQVECPNNMAIALEIAQIMANSLKEVGEDLKLNCPLAGSYYNDDLKDYTIGTNWKVTH